MSQDDALQNLENVLATPKTLVVKVGSALLVNDDGSVRREWLEALAQDMQNLRSKGHRIVLVSSGAIRVGLKQMGIQPGGLTLAEKQAAAALGQISLAQVYADVFAPHNWPVGQMLLTAGDTEDRRRYINSREALDRLLAMDALPLINENDSVATGEIRFGDNDRLAARVAGMIGAELLFLLSDIDGLYSANPREDENAVHIPTVHGVITPEIESMAGVVRAGYSSGGMVTKLRAAQIAMGASCDMLIADGRAAAPISRLLTGERFTLFKADPHASKRAREKWLTGALNLQGQLILDDGAIRAVCAGKSLLPAGVTAVQGQFSRGDVVALVSIDGVQIGRGIALYDGDDAAKIAGHNSAEIESLLGFTRGNTLIHADDLATYEP